VSVFCSPGSLVGARGWLPAEPFDYNWDRFGCNQLRCGRCGQTVRSHVLADGNGRHYECACQRYDAYEYHLLGSDQGYIHEFVTAWDCGGHPELPLPHLLDGVRVAADADFGAIVAATLPAPPFVAPGTKAPSFWVQRLYRLVQRDDVRRAIGEAVAALLSSTEARTLRAALDFFAQLPEAPGGERVAEVVARDRARLAATADPTSSSYNLYERALEAITRQLAARPTAAAVAVARAALLDGSGDSGLLYRVAAHDPEWFCNHAADIVRASAAMEDYVRAALEDVPEHDRERALRNLSRLDPA
jgi:hypothetical protein